MNEEQWRERIDELLTSIDNQGYKSKELLERVDNIQATLNNHTSHLASIQSSLGCLVLFLIVIPLIGGLIGYALVLNGVL